ncbi:HAD family hydrolase [Oribacterium sp. WCC10]|uniref:HAD family hydrolase n=1 Tax=Oribacterium sp. WCC10 TaxID=1855343 RepID=UPI0008EC7166|nr:HAD family phosphatase [Oribacterium sp. WCC10]SFG35926.1 haloacid dehalogenase superfamily, subfamily IA, variant 3 with third motif having DD or ED [Oribacterium sp. WCC10]
MKYDYIKGFIFDMDGTMFDTERVYHHFWKVAAKERGFTMTDEMIDSMRGASLENIGVLFRECNPDYDYLEERAIREKYILEYFEMNPVPKKEGLDELFEWIHEKGYKVALGSSSVKNRVMMYMDKTGYTEKFDYICSGDMIKNGKPAPDIFIHCADMLGLKPEECIVVEDSLNGIRAGYEAGCRVFGIKDMSPLDGVRNLMDEEPEKLSDIINIIEGK